MKRLLLAVAATALLWALPAMAADPSQISIASHYDLPETGHTVRASHTLTPQVTGDFTIELPVTAVQALKLSYDHSEIPLDVTSEEAEITSAGQTIKTTRFHFTLSQKRAAVLSYETDSLAREYGKTVVFALPTLPATAANVQSVELNAPVSRGLAISYSAAAADTSIGSGQQSYRFTATAGSPPQVLLMFGTAATANVKWETRLSNGSWWWQRRELVLPPDTNQQTVFLKSIEPRPTQLRVDEDGNVIASFRIGPKKSLTVSAEASVNLRSAGYNTSNTRTLADIPQQLKSYTTGMSEPADSAVLVVVKQRFDEALAKIESDGAETALKQLRDSLQSSGVPTREVHGLRFLSAGQIVEPHASGQWLEVFVPGIGWMTLDPASGLYGQSDFQHLGLGIVSPLSQPALESSLDDTSVNFTDETLPDTAYDQTKVHVTKHILLPGLSLTRTTLQLPPGSVLDNATVESPDSHPFLGSLAPLQHVSRWSLSLAAASWHTGEVKFGPGGTDGIGEVLATGSTSLNYWGVVIEVLTIASVTGLVVKLRRSSRRIGRRRPLLTKNSDETAIAPEDLLRDRSSKNSPE